MYYTYTQFEYLLFLKNNEVLKLSHKIIKQISVQAEDTYKKGEIGYLY